MFCGGWIRLKITGCSILKIVVPIEEVLCRVVVLLKCIIKRLGSMLVSFKLYNLENLLLWLWLLKVFVVESFEEHLVFNVEVSCAL